MAARERRWPHVDLADLEDAGRLLELARRLVRAGWLPRSESSALLVFSAAEHALAVGRDPPALFCATLREPRCVTDLEDERGRRRALEARGRLPRARARHDADPVLLGALLPEKWLS